MVSTPNTLCHSRPPSCHCREKPAPDPIRGRNPFSSILCVILAFAHNSNASAETDIELRASTAEYRYFELSHAPRAHIVFDVLYAGYPGENELYVGAGFISGPTLGISITPLVYDVFGIEDDDRGIAPGVQLHLDGERTQLVGFAGHFFRTEGDVSDYSFIDPLDLTLVAGRCEVGGSAVGYESEGVSYWSVGPVLNSTTASARPASRCYSTTKTNCASSARSRFDQTGGRTPWSSTITSSTRV